MTTRPVPSPRRQQLTALGIGLAAGGCGAWWILATHTTRPGFSLHYHVPLATAFGCWVGFVALAARGRTRSLLAIATAVGLALVAARVALYWPMSGHGVLAALIATACRWAWLRLLAAAILVQALITKWAEGADPLAVVWGAMAGYALARLAQRGSYT